MDLELEKLKGDTEMIEMIKDEQYDRLFDLWNKQKEFDDYMCDVQGIDPVEDKMMLLGNCMTALSVEVAEMQNELKYFAHWKINKPDTVTKEVKEEFTDCLCFIFSIANKLFENPDEMIEYYDRKREINITRQKNKY